MWWNGFGPMFASDNRRARGSRTRGFRHWRWHQDGMYVKLNGEMVYLWRAVNHEGEILESYITRTRDKDAALTFMKKALKRHGTPEKITTDGLRFYRAAMTELGNEDKQETGRWANKQVENSYVPFRRRERALIFRRMKTLQKFASVHANPSGLELPRCKLPRDGDGHGRVARRCQPRTAQPAPWAVAQLPQQRGRGRAKAGTRSRSAAPSRESNDDPLKAWYPSTLGSVDAAFLACQLAINWVGESRMILPSSDQSSGSIASRRLYRIVARGLTAAINEGRYVLRSRLPAERELAIEYGVSRATIREAIIALEVRGLVEVRVGSGVYVRRAALEKETTLPNVTAFDLTEARLLFEGEAAALAAGMATDEDFARLDRLVAMIDAENRSGAAGEEPDREFHLEIARATGNGAIARTVEMLWDLRSGSPECAVLFARARRDGSKAVVEEHSRIVAALRTRKPEEARAAMRAHLSAVIEHLLATTEAAAIERARAEAGNTRSRYLSAANV